ncbi:hypothetical protein J6X09_02575 [Candidatus Saccharibacteria bacterium]|nr:hypothetical protein [Candidatus Saccharibacteria bacterium]
MTLRVTPTLYRRIHPEADR